MTTTAKTEKISQIQEIQIQLLRLSTFNELDGDRVADDLLAHRDLWLSFMIDREAYGPFYRLREIYEKGAKKGELPVAPIDTIRLRDMHQIWNVDALFILPAPRKEGVLERLAQSWNANEINWYDPGDARHIWLNEPKIGEVAEQITVKKMLRVWWD